MRSNCFTAIHSGFYFLDRVKTYSGRVKVEYKLTFATRSQKIEFYTVAEAHGSISFFNLAFVISGYYVLESG